MASAGAWVTGKVSDIADRLNHDAVVLDQDHADAGELRQYPERPRIELQQVRQIEADGTGVADRGDPGAFPGTSPATSRSSQCVFASRRRSSVWTVRPDRAPAISAVSCALTMLLAQIPVMFASARRIPRRSASRRPLGLRGGSMLLSSSETSSA
jgi:hypothetical protein